MDHDCLRIAIEREDSMDIAGGCFCGAVRYTFSGDAMLAGHCQCTRCRKGSGTGHSSFLAAPENGFKLTGELTFYEAPADSGNMVSRGFCPTCGSNVLARNSGMPGIVFLLASTFDDPALFKPQFAVFTDYGANWDHLDPALPAFARMPPPEAMGG